MLIAAAYFFIAFGALWQSYRDPQVNLSFLTENATALVFLSVFIGVGLLLILYLQRFSSGGTNGLYMLGIVGAWAGLTILWFMRKHPNDRKPPDFLLRPLGPVDRALLFLAGFCVWRLV